MLLSQSCNTHFEISVKTINQDTSNVSSLGEKSAGKQVNYRTSNCIYLATNCFREQTILRYVIRSIKIQSDLKTQLSCSQYLILQIFYVIKKTQMPLLKQQLKLERMEELSLEVQQETLFVVVVEELLEIVLAKSMESVLSIDLVCKKGLEK